MMICSILKQIHFTDKKHIAPIYHVKLQGQLLSMCLLATENWWSVLVSQDGKHPRHILGLCRTWIQHVLSYA